MWWAWEWVVKVGMVVGTGVMGPRALVTAAIGYSSCKSDRKLKPTRLTGVSPPYILLPGPRLEYLKPAFAIIA